MEGSYMTKAQRARIAQGIRKTHFDFGHNKDKHVSSSRDLFSLPNSQYSDKSIVRQQSNLVLGTDGKSMKTKTEFTERYRQFNSASSSSFNAETKEDLRRHHFKFGNHGNQYTTTTGGMFTSSTPGPIGPNQDIIRERKQKLGKHNFQFGTDKNKPQTTTKEAFGPKRAENIDHNKLKQMINDLRGSHFPMGSEECDYTSSNQEQFKPKYVQKDQISENIKAQHKKINVNLGSDQGPKQSMTHFHHQGKTQAKTPLNQQMLNDLRAHHFALGSQPPDYTALSKSQYSNSKGLHESPTYNSVSARKTHFVLGVGKDPWKSTYSLSHNSRGQSVNLAVRNKVTEQASNIEMGKFPPQCISTAKESFRHHINSPTDNQDIINKAKKPNVSLGSNMRYYDTSNKVYGQQGGPPSKLDLERMNELRNSHFKYGSSNDKIITSNQIAFSERKPERAASKSSHSLRSHNFQLGTTSNMWHTTYGGSFTWVKPVPAPLIKYSYEQQYNEGINGNRVSLDSFSKMCLSKKSSFT